MMVATNKVFNGLNGTNYCAPATARDAGKDTADKTDSFEAGVNDGEKGERTGIPTENEVTRRPVEIPVQEIPGGMALVGTNQAMIQLEEEPSRREKCFEPSRIITTAVTNKMFTAFFNDAAYKIGTEKFG